MAAGRKEYELQMRLTAALGSNFNSSFQTAMSTTKKLQNTLSKLKTVQGDISAYKKTQEAISAVKSKVGEYETKHNALQSELAQTKAKEKELQKALKQSEETAGAESDEYKELSKQLQETRNQKSKLKSQIKDNERATATANEKIKEQEQRLSDLSNELRTAGVNTNNLTQENDKLERAYTRVQKAQESYARVNSAIENNKAAISATKNELTKTIGVIGTAGAAFYKGFITPAAELQAQMSNVKALISSSSGNNIGADMAKLTALAKEMGATTKFTAVEAGKALEYMGMAGWKANQMINGLPGIMNLAAASSEDLATVSDIVTDALTAFNMTADDSGHFADVLAAASTNANTNVSMMGETFKYCAPLAGTLKWSVDDVANAIGLMANAGVKATNSGTALRSLMTRLATNAGASKNSLGALDILTEKLGVQFYGAGGKVRDFKSIITETRAAYSKLTQEEKINYANKIAGKNALSGFMALMNASDEDLNKLTVSIDECGGAAAKMAEIKQDNLIGNITIAKSAWDGLATTIGDLFLPNLQEAVKKVTEFLNKANVFAQRNPELIKQIAKVAAGLAALQVGALTGKLGLLEMNGGILQVAKSFLGFRVEAAEAAADAVTGEGRFAAFGKSITEYFGKVKSSVGGVGSAINNLSGSVLSNVFGKITNPLGSLSEKIKNIFGGTFGKIPEVFGTIGNKIASGPLGKIGGVFSSLGKSIGAVVGGPLKALGGLFGGLFGKAMPIIAIISALSIALLKLSGEDISGFIEPLKSAFEELKPILTDTMQKFQELGKDMLPLIMDTAKTLAPLLGQIITGILPVILELIKSLVPIISQLVKDMLPPILNIITTLSPLLTKVITDILPIITTLLETLMPIVSQFASGILPIIASAIGALLPLIKDLIEAVLPILMSVMSALMPVIQALAELFKSALGSAIDSIKPIIESLTGVLKGVIDFVTGVFTGDWSKAWEGVVSVFKNIWDTITGIISGVGDFFGNIFSGIGDFFGSIFGGNKETDGSLDIPKFENGSNYTPDTFIAGDVNGKGGELITGARGRKVFTAAQTSEIFRNINRAKAINGLSARNVTISGMGAVKNAALEQFDAAAKPEISTITNTGGEIKFEINYNPTIYIEGDKPEDLEEKLKQNNEKLLRIFKEYLRQERETERRMSFA